MAINVRVTIRRGIGKLEASVAFGKVYAKRGYLVIGTVPGVKYEIGRRLRQVFQYETTQVFVVTGFTTKKDMMEQLKMLQEFNPTWVSDFRHGWGRGGTFYRIMPLAAKKHQDAFARKKTPRLLGAAK